MMHQPDTSTDALHIADRRNSRRLDLRLSVEIRKLGMEDPLIVRTVTKNVSTGGLYLELDRPDFQPGDRFTVQLTVPPAEGVSTVVGHATAIAEVLRCRRIEPDPHARLERFGIAARFTERLRIRY